MRSGRFSILALGLFSAVFALPRDGSHGEDEPNDDKNDGSNDAAASSTSPFAPSTTPSTSTSTNSSSTNPLIGMNGDVVCLSYSCVGGLVNGSTVTYTLQSLGNAPLGWMAMGFGSQMANTPMVIMWPNSDGSVTLSQRKAPGEVMPTVDPNPPRIATLDIAQSVATGNNPKLVFTIPFDPNSNKDIIWAFGTTPPNDPSPDATLIQHLESGPTQLDLTKVISETSRDPTNPVSLMTVGSGSSSSNIQPQPNILPAFRLPPLLPYEKYIVAHAILCIIGFLGLLPLGAIIARWMRTFSPVWFRLHWIIQWVLALPVIVAGVACGITAVHMEEIKHLSDTHMKWGVTIFVLYFVQISLGGIIHFFKIPALARKGIRAPQNYLHALLGLFIIGAAFYQVRTGFRTEWPFYTGRGSVGNGANIVWIVWLVLIPVFYFSGLIWLRRQYRQEREMRAQKDATYQSPSIMSQRPLAPGERTPMAPGERTP